jgi:hypothetical protein
VNASNVTLKNMFFNGNGTTSGGGTCIDTLAVGTSSNTPCNAAVYFNVASAVTIDRLYLNGTGSAENGFNGASVAGMTMSNTEVASFAGSNKTAADFQNLTGTVNITNANFHNNTLAHNWFITNNTGTATITFTSASIANSPVSASGNADGIDVQVYSGATINISCVTCTFTNLASNSVNWGAGQGSTPGANGATMISSLSGGTSTNTAGTLFQQTGTATVHNFTISGVTITTSTNGSNAITVGPGGGSGSSTARSRTTPSRAETPAPERSAFPSTRTARAELAPSR